MERLSPLMIRAANDFIYMDIYIYTYSSSDALALARTLCIHPRGYYMIKYHIKLPSAAKQTGK
jgi:hypothetical protein